MNIWSRCQRTLVGELRPNNFAGAAHRRPQVEFGVSNPSVWKLIDGLRKVQRNRDCQLEQYNGGLLPRPKARRHMDTDANLLELVKTVD